VECREIHRVFKPLIARGEARGRVLTAGRLSESDKQKEVPAADMPAAHKSLRESPARLTVFSQWGARGKGRGAHCSQKRPANSSDLACDVFAWQRPLGPGRGKIICLRQRCRRGKLTSRESPLRYKTRVRVEQALCRGLAPLLGVREIEDGSSLERVRKGGFKGEKRRKRKRCLETRGIGRSLGEDERPSCSVRERLNRWEIALDGHLRADR